MYTSGLLAWHHVITILAKPVRNGGDDGEDPAATSRVEVLVGDGEAETSGRAVVCDLKDDAGALPLKDASDMAPEPLTVRPNKFTECGWRGDDVKPVRVNLVAVETPGIKVYVAGCGVLSDGEVAEWDVGSVGERDLEAVGRDDVDSGRHCEGKWQDAMRMRGRASHVHDLASHVTLMSERMCRTG